MWAHEVDRSEYSELLDAIERGLPGETLLEDGRA
jgi:hypothetical protein